MRAVRKGAASMFMACVCLAAACSSGPSPASAKVSVTAAFYPLAFVAEQLGGAAVNVTNLTPPGAEPHDLELRPTDVFAIRNARLVLYLHGLQPAVDDAVRQDPARAFDALAVISVRHAADGSVDPHFFSAK